MRARLEALVGVGESRVEGDEEEGGSGRVGRDEARREQRAVEREPASSGRRFQVGRGLRTGERGDGAGAHWAGEARTAA
eukprot:3766930-Pleurochrysis_carterae.AAC.1